MSNSTKKGFGVYATLVSAVLAIAAAVIYQVIGGKFGATQRVCYDQWVVLLLIGGGVVSGALVGLKKYGVASAIAAFAPFAAICFFAHAWAEPFASFLILPRRFRHATHH